MVEEGENFSKNGPFFCFMPPFLQKTASGAALSHNEPDRLFSETALSFLSVGMLVLFRRGIDLNRDWRNGFVEP